MKNGSIDRYIVLSFKHKTKDRLRCFHPILPKEFTNLICIPTLLLPIDVIIRQSKLFFYKIDFELIIIGLVKCQIDFDIDT